MSSSSAILVYGLQLVAGLVAATVADCVGLYAFFKWGLWSVSLIATVVVAIALAFLNPSGVGIAVIVGSSITGACFVVETVLGIRSQLKDG